MSASTPQSSSPVAGDDRNLVTVDESYLAPTFEDKVRIFWDKHGRTLVTVLVVVLIGLVARWAFDLYVAHRESQIRAAYAEAADSAALKAFAAANPAAPLAGVAKLRLADEAYAAGDYAGAAALYQEAVSPLGADPLSARARLGAAVSQLQSGADGARASLETLANDTALPAVLRAETSYHLAVIGRDAADVEAARKWATLASTVDAGGLWAQRADQILSALPAAAVTTAPAPATAAPAITAPVSVTPATTAEEVKITFPGATK